MTTSDKFDKDTLYDAEDVGPENADNVKPSKAKNIAGLFSNKKTRNIIIASILIFGGVGVLAVLTFGSGPKEQIIPEAYKGVNAGNAPTSLTADKSALDSPRFDDLAKTMDEKKLAEARLNNDSVQPSAVGAYAFSGAPTSNSNSGAPTLGLSSGERQQQVQPSQPEYTQAMSPADVEAQKLILANVTAAITRNIGMWDAPRGPKLLNGADVRSQSSASNTGTGSSGANIASSGAVVPGSSVANQLSTTLIRAGTLGPVRIDIPLNTDEPGSPAVATLLSGPFAGAKLIGTFAKNQDDTLTGKFTSMSIPNSGITVAIRANTINPDDKTHQGIATDVDQHLIVKYGLKPLAAALSAVGQAYAKQSTTTVNLLGGVGSTTSTPPITPKSAQYIAAGSAAEQFAQDVANKKVESTVSVSSQTVVGVVFIDDVIYSPSLKDFR